jgi:putative membrane protein
MQAAGTWEERFVSGLRFSDAAKVSEMPNGFSRWLSLSPAQPLKRADIAVVVARLKACPDTNRSSNWTRLGVVMPLGGGCVAENINPNRARDHLANERTFLAWVRTGAAIVVFGFAIGRFSIAMRQLTALQGHPLRTVGISVWMGSFTIVAGVAMVLAGLVRYRKTREQIDSGTFEPAGFVVDFITTLTVLFGLALAGYLIYAEKSLG